MFVMDDKKRMVEVASVLIKFAARRAAVNVLPGREGLRNR
jgi:NADH:ubiquinone oxidoreductase subunit F (NADH-binding)